MKVEARSCVEPAGNEWEHARRLEKSLKSGVVDGSELSTYDVGLLRRYRPWALVPAEVEYE